MSTFQSKYDKDGIGAHVNTRVGNRAPEGTVALVGAGPLGMNVRESYVDREDAVGIIEALTTAVEAADAREAEAEAARWKRGDVVTLVGGTGDRRIIIRDEVDGFVDIVMLEGPYAGRRRLTSAAARYTRSIL